MKTALYKITQSFDAAASGYDRHASLQQEIASYLVDWSKKDNPHEILDIGTGTGFVAKATHTLWPKAHITALDAAPQMLLEAARKIPGLSVVLGDARAIRLEKRFDAIYSSMMLHWLSEPHKILNQWRNMLNPNGSLYVALPTHKSFEEWRRLCEENGLKNGLWPMPKTDFAKDLRTRYEIKEITVPYASALDFLHQLKSIGAATPDPVHKPFKISRMRSILKKAPVPFNVTYQILVLEIPQEGKV